MHLYDTANENHPTQVVQSIYYNMYCINTRPTNKVIVEHLNVFNAYDVLIILPCLLYYVVWLWTVVYT